MAVSILLLAAFAGILFFVAVIKTIVLARISPLWQLPAPTIWAHFSRLTWAFPHEFQGTITMDLPKLHEQLGPLIRIAPNEVSFYSREIYDTVHKVGSKFKKDPRTYGEFVQGGHPALFSITDPVEHSKRRRIMGALFSRSKVPQLEALMAGHVQRFLQAVDSCGSLINVSKACRALEADIVSDFSFGTPIQAVDAWAAGTDLALVTKNDEKATWMPVLTTFPTLVELWEQFEKVILQTTGFETSYSRGLRYFRLWCNAALEISVKEEKALTSPNLIHTLTRAGLPNETALAEARENLGPGTDTTSATLAHILWALAQNPRFQDLLYSDLADRGFPTDIATLESIPLLQACIKEGIRWAGAAAAMLPRIVPPGGITLQGNYIPAGTVMTSSPIWYLHDKTAFPEPHSFSPHRWLTSDGQHLSQNSLRDRFYIPFSTGANICLGSHFAYLELYISLSQILRDYRLSLDGAGGASSASSGEQWNPVLLPKRKEWVAAVTVEDLEVHFDARA